MSASEPVLEIDGSSGEGGGQILRSSLSLSILYGRGFHISNIRGARQNPGLAEQHLVAVAAAARICAAQVEGAALRSRELTFRPGKIRSGRYRFQVRTAGSAVLVLQTVFLPLARSGSATSIQIIGGTHVPWSPSFHYLDLHWLPCLRQAGYDAQLNLHTAGFYPQGGGHIGTTVRPVGRVSPLIINRRGKLSGIVGLSVVANLPLEIAERQKRQALGRLLKALPGVPAPDIRIRLLQLPSPGKGTMLLLKGSFEGGSCCFSSLGEPGKPAERVADQAVDQFLAFLESDGAVDPYLADQLMLPLLQAEGPSELRTSEISSHQLTNAAVLQAFLPGSIKILGQPGKPGTIIIQPRS